MKKNQKIQMNQESKQQLVGWLLFVLCALFFIASSLKNRDILTFIGSVLFLISCVVFIIPLVRKIKNSETGNSKLYDKDRSIEAKNFEAD